MSEAVPCTSLTPGSWTARWGAWVIGIRTDDEDRWCVRIWSWAVGARVQIAKRAILPTAADAVAWACEVLRKHGTSVFIDGAYRPIEDVLAFVREDAKLCS